jgi:nicotinamide-nucleotide amidase
VGGPGLVNIFDPINNREMKAEIVNIGDELLIGQITNTNAVWLAQQFNTIGVPIARMTTIADREQDIILAVDKAFNDHDLIILTGGLGPTKDDITKKTLATYFDTELIFNQLVYEQLNAWFTSRGREFTEVNQTQCYVPANCKVLMNKWGTAPAMLFEKNGKYLASFPGVPREMKNLVTEYLIPFIEEEFNLPPLVHRSFNIEGIPESELMKTIEDWEDNLPKTIKLAYLPSAGILKLRMSSLNEDGNATAIMDTESKKLHEIIGDDIFGYEEQTLEEVIKELLLTRNQTLCTAESCTGGYLAHKITSVPGVSKIFPGSFVTYDYWVKTDILGVKDDTLQKFGAVSKEVVLEMANAAKEKLKTDYAIALSGIAGPDGGTPDKPVGTVWIAWATPNGMIAKRFAFPGDRLANIHLSYQKALNILRRLIIGLPLKKEFWERE